MVEMTYDLAHACGMDEANRQMKKEGRTSWNDKDYSLAVETMDRLYWNNLYGNDK
jgi:hypothetical protein